MQQLITLIQKELNLSQNAVKNAVRLFDDGATIPFIARYRKEATGSLDEIQLEAIKKKLDTLRELIKRKESILKTIEEQGQLSDELAKKIENCWNGPELEDLYLPYKRKRKTKASMAREKGLEPLAKIIMAQNESHLSAQAQRFVNDKVASQEEALEGARHIISEWINENERARKRIRSQFEKHAVISATVIKTKEQEAGKYADYFDFSEKLSKIPSHRLLAIRRGEAEGLLRVKITADEEKSIEMLDQIFVKSDNECTDQLELAIEDAYKRLIHPSIENEFAGLAKLKADEEAISVFARNLEQLLLEAPLGQKRVMGIDPGFKSGCKVVCLDAQGKLEHNQNVYPFGPDGDKRMASKQIRTLVNSFKIDAIAIGNGTAGRETEDLIRSIRFDRDIKAFVVSEDGASVYSASEVAREEFEKYDVTVRGAVSIGRRLMDPLAELVKIDPKSLGIGQYQHAVDQKLLKDALQRTTEKCVNKVGVNLNTASRHILMHVSGLGDSLAQNIIDYRTENGAFESREELKKVKRMGAKAFEQAAGFLRIRDGKNELDNTAVHPERYGLVKKMAADMNVTVHDLISDKNIRQKIDLKKYVDAETGMPTLNDIIKELEKPGLDPREQIKVFEFSRDIRKIEDLHEGMVLPGIVTNITNFGAFVDIGIKENGLLHVSEMADRFISDPNEIVCLHQQLQVKIIRLDIERKRISLSLKQA